MKIVILDGYTANPGDLDWSPLENYGELTVYERTAKEDVLSRIQGAQIVLTNKTVIDREVIENAPDMKYVGVLATGYNVVDLKAASEKGIIVTNIPAYSTDSVVQLVFAHLLEICHHVGRHSDSVHAGKWSASRDFAFWDYPLMELAGKTMGIIGYGRIGKKVAEVARAFGMKVIAWTRTPRDPECVTLDELLAASDVISLHCPLFPETTGLINRETIAKMKDGVILINTSRGPVINDADLCEALLCGKVGYAAIDVAVTEPIPADNPLLGLENVLITPHIGWATYEARVRLVDIAVRNVKAFVEGAPVNRVN